MNDSLGFSNIIIINSYCFEGVQGIEVFKLYFESHLTRCTLARKDVLDDSIISLVRTRLSNHDVCAKQWVLVGFEEMASHACVVYCV